MIKEDYRHPELKFETEMNMQLDLFIPELCLAFEYQGEQHYYDMHHQFQPQRQYAERDEQKRIACFNRGIALIEVPYWWDFGLDSLRVTIWESRPDLILPTKSSISQTIPKEQPKQFAMQGKCSSRKLLTNYQVLQVYYLYRLIGMESKI